MRQMSGVEERPERLLHSTLRILNGQAVDDRNGHILAQRAISMRTRFVSVFMAPNLGNSFQDQHRLQQIA